MKRREVFYGILAVVGGILIHFTFGPVSRLNVPYWFPARRGLVVGMIVGGFGLGALIFTPIQTAYINPDNIKVNNKTRQMTDEAVLDRVPSAFLMLGGILLSLQVIGFILLRPKPVSTTESGDKKVEDGKKDMGDLDNAPGLESEGMLKEKTEESLAGSRTARIDRSYRDDEVEEENLQPKQVIRRLDFYLLWLVMFCNIIPITIITSIYKYFGQEYISDDFFLSSVATVSALFNCGGRIMWGAIVDKISFKIPLCVMLFLWSLILITFPHLSFFDGVLLKSLYTIWVCLLFLSLSGVFVMMPAATGILFGPANLAVNYGLVFNAFAAGSLVCGVITTLVEAKNAYLVQFTGCGCVCLIALFTALWIEDRKMPRKWNICRWCTSQCKNLRGGDTGAAHESVKMDKVEN
ncbi:Oxalate:formate antiporter [Paragonimus skrjabini miyazakii]|uniref:Oxalate:formate antiporter n=1 Tax=Paragonimus skrjabini miyazakii TaxID=59628 RepID=A0A8S9Z0B2_9TREM|nr:Oxalate:formate antiporter [Paragonimus skrjabini miyazakii]